MITARHVALRRLANGPRTEWKTSACDRREPRSRRRNSKDACGRRSDRHSGGPPCGSDRWLDRRNSGDIRGRVRLRAARSLRRRSVDGLCDRLLEAGGVDILVGNSGGPPPAEAREAKREDWLVHFEAMAANLFHLTQRLVPPMAQRGWGRIVTIASSGVEQPIPRLALSNGSGPR